MSQASHDPDLFHAGGFIATADEIVQPFNLPRSQYIRHKDRAPSPPANGDDAEMVPDSEGAMEEELPAPCELGSTRALEDERGGEGEGIEVQSEPGTASEPMKTMAELAAEHAERERQLGLGSTRGSKPRRRSVRSSRARRKSGDDDSENEPDMDEDEDISEPSLSDDPSEPSPPRKRRAASLRVPSRRDARSTSKPTPKTRKKRLRSPDTDEGSDVGYTGSSRLKERSTGSHPRQMARRAGKSEPRTPRTVSGSSATSIAVPASDRVLRSRKARV